MPALPALVATPTGAHQLASAWAKPGCRLLSSWERRCPVIKANEIRECESYKRRIAPPMLDSMGLLIEMVLVHRTCGLGT